MYIEKIKKLSQEKKITIKELSERIGMSFSGLYSALSNNTLKVYTLFKISKELKVPITYFFDDSALNENNDIELLHRKIISLEKEKEKLKSKIESRNTLSELLSGLNIFYIDRYIDLLEKEDKDSSELRTAKLYKMTFDKLFKFFELMEEGRDEIIDEQIKDIYTEIKENL